MALNDPTLLHENSLARIEQTVAEIEKQTSCEFAVVLAPASSRYEVPVVPIAALIAVVFFVALDALNYFVLETELLASPLWLMACALAAGTGVALFVSSTSLKRKLVGPKAERKAVDLAAAACFWEQKVGFTHAHNAVLLYVSLEEGQARVLPDAGVIAKLPAARFGELEQQLNNNAGDALESVCNTLRDLGTALKDAFPRAANDANEVPDKPVVRYP